MRAPRHRRLCAIAVLAVALLAVQTIAAADRSIIIVAGQSNVLNWHAAASQLPADPRDATILFYYETGAPPSKGGAVPFNSNSEGRWTTLRVQQQEPFVKFEREFFGPEITLARALADLGPLGVIKVGYFGSNLAQDWDPDATAGNRLYARLTENIQRALHLLTEKGEQPRLAGFFWMQGETDGAKAEHAEAYARNLTRFVARVRADLAAPALPFVLGRIGPRPSKGYAYQDMVRAAQVAVVADGAAMAWVDTDDQARFTDSVHLLAPGVMVLGERMASAWKRLQPRPKS